MPLQVLNITASVSSVVSGESVSCQITLTGSAPAQGVEVGVSCASSSVSVPAMVPVPAGANQSKSFTVTTASVPTLTKVSITASLNGATVSVPLTLVPLQPVKMILAMDPIIGGAATTGTVILNAPAPSTIQVALASMSALVGIQQAVPVLSGYTQSQTFSVSTKAVTSPTPVTVTATYENSTISNVLDLLPLLLLSFSINPGTVVGGKNTTGVVDLNGTAPAATAIGVSMLPLGLANLVGSASVPAGESTGSFALSTAGISSLSQPRTVAITASCGGVSQTVNLTLTPSSPPPVTLKSLTIFPATVSGGGSSVSSILRFGPL